MKIEYDFHSSPDSRWAEPSRHGKSLNCSLTPIPRPVHLAVASREGGRTRTTLLSVFGLCLLNNWLISSYPSIRRH